MTKLLNRIALLLSILIGFGITFLIYGFFGGFRYFGGDDSIVFIMFSAFVGLIFKKIYLSENFIIERLNFFSKQIETKILESKSTYSKKDKVNLEDEIVVVNKTKDNDITNDYLNNEYVVNDYVEKIEKLETKTSLKTNLIPKQEKIEKESIIMKNIAEFFSTNLLAKIGSILVFLGVLFLLSLIWSTLPSIVKIILGFIIGFGIYFTGVILDNKGLKGESRILLGTGILINFLVILGGKFVLEGNVNSTEFFSTGVTFLFLILNTIFGVVTSLVYKSRTMLLFSFIFAYLNPFLIGESSTTPYTLVGYSAIVSIGALIVGNKENSNFLKISAFILGNILFILAPFDNEMGWIIKFVASAMLSLGVLYNLYKDNYKNINSVFITSFIFLILGLISGSDNGLINNNLSFVTYLISILVFFFVGITLFLKNAISNLLSIIIFPILIILGLLFVGDLHFIEISLGTVIIAYLIGFSLISNPSNNDVEIGNGIKYVFFSILGIFIFIVNSYLSFSLTDINFISFITVLIVSFVFLISSYIFSNKNNLNYLYTIGTIGTVFTLLPVVNLDLAISARSAFDLSYVQDQFVNLIKPFCIIAISLFGLINTFWPFINKSLIKEKTNIRNLVIGLIVGALFLGGELYRYGLEYFPGVSLGFAFVGLAIFYFILSFIFIGNIGFENIKKDDSYKNSLFGYLFVSISIFSIAIALIFSKSPEVVSLIWLFEATILFYFFGKTKESKIFNGAIILFIIGIVKLLELENYVERGDLMFLVPISLIIISFVLNIKYIDWLENSFRKNIHDIIHIIGMLTVATLIVKIVPQTNHGWSTLGIASFVGISGLIYNDFKSQLLKIFFVVLLLFFTLEQISSFDYITYKLQEDNLRHLISLQYLSTAIITAIVVYWNKFNNISIYNKTLNGITLVYLLIIISTYIYDIFNNTFAITIFWGIISIYLLIRGIGSDKIKLRTIGLYLLTLVLSKIFLYDIWYGLDNAVSRVIVFIILGILLIFVSTRYSKKYGNNLIGEFNLNNLNSDIKEEKPKAQTKKEMSNEEITSQIKKVDLKGVNGASFKINGKVAFSTKSKNILQIIVYVLNKTGLTEFEANELKPFYEFITSHYISDLSTRDLNTVQNAFKTFVEAGGEVIIKRD
ncbi:MAG: DUF2339 domain-containing protein [Candidatus Gracilibacteria bacterium]|nr:DUF2339 domain-containing protein [Candidatus Gracilibacteria bacterium]